MSPISPPARVPERWGRARQLLADFRRSCQPEVVIGPRRLDHHQDHRLVAELITTEFRSNLVLDYEILKGESDLPTPSLYLPLSLPGDCPSDDGGAGAVLPLSVGSRLA